MALANSLRPYSLLFLSHGPDVDQSKLSNAEVLPSTAICSLTAEEYRFTRSNKKLMAYDLRHFVLSSLVAFWRSRRGFHQLISDTIRLVGFQLRLFWKSTRNSRRYSYELIISASLSDLGGRWIEAIRRDTALHLVHATAKESVCSGFV